MNKKNLKDIAIYHYRWLDLRNLILQIGFRTWSLKSEMIKSIAYELSRMDKNQASIFRAKKVVELLIKEAMIEKSLDRDSPKYGKVWQLSRNGHILKCQRAVRRILRSKADQLIKELLRRVEAYNNDNRNRGSTARRFRRPPENRSKSNRFNFTLFTCR